MTLEAPLETAANSEGRRRFLLAAAASVVVGCGGKAKSPEGGEEEDVSPAEDLMREHGVLNRILLIYEDGARRVDARAPLPAEVLPKSADLIRRFVEQYHEKLEENFLFPRFERANKLTDLVATLRRQHQAGRALTETILRLASSSAESDRPMLATALRSFTRMYRPHEAREDTVLFPALPSVMGKKELEELGERFEDEEHQLFGREGFEGIVKQVAVLEQAMGLYDLDQFTPAT